MRYTYIGRGYLSVGSCLQGHENLGNLGDAVGIILRWKSILCRSLVVLRALKSCGGIMSKVKN